jgi:alginate O-acetyltransferase complex protein AlgI
LPVTLTLYFFPVYTKWKDPDKALAWQNAVLLVCSLLFYAWGEPLFVLLMLATVGLNALLALLIARGRYKRLLLWCAIALDVGLLFFFKYLPALGFSVSHLPLGISFYTFQAISYVADVYRGATKPAKSPLTVALYVALFPQLIAGPILRYTEVEHALTARRHSLHGAAAGARRFIAGLAKKLLLANPAGALFAAQTARQTLGAAGAWLALFSFAFQLYFDFSGYSDMAIGLGRILGFRFPENFRYPYTATSITDFWRRWHITLSTFFREYVYFPLGGSREGDAKTLRNLLVVWALTGLWHGASLNFLLWGLYYFLLLVIEKFLLRRFFHRVPRALCRTLTLACVCFGWLLFAFDGSTPTLMLSRLPAFLGSLFFANGASQGAELYDLIRSLPLLALCALGATPLPRRALRRFTGRGRHPLLRTALPLLALVFCMASLADASYNPFLYFRF